MEMSFFSSCKRDLPKKAKYQEINLIASIQKLFPLPSVHSNKFQLPKNVAISLRIHSENESGPDYICITDWPVIYYIVRPPCLHVLEFEVAQLIQGSMDIRTVDRMTKY